LTSYPSSHRLLAALTLVLLGATACTSAQPPTSAEVEAALEGQLRDQGIPCDILEYSNIHVNDSNMPSDNIAKLNVAMDVTLVGAGFPPDCERFMSRTDGAQTAERAVQRIITAYGERESMAYEWQLSNHALRLTRDKEDHWRVAPATPD